MPIGLGTILAGVGSLLGLGASIFSQDREIDATKALNKKQRQFIEKMYRQKRADSLEFWKMRNQYNTPASQMQRLVDAGLNPNLMYGQGNVGNASTLDAPSSGNWNPQVPNYSGYGRIINGSFSNYFQYKQMQAQTNNVQQNAELKKLMAVSEATKNAGYLIDNARNKFELNKARSLLKTQVSTQKQLLKNLKKDAKLKDKSLYKMAEKIKLMQLEQANTKAQRKKIRFQIQNLKTDTKLKAMSAKLKANGISWGDALYMRILAQFVDLNYLEEMAGNQLGEVPKELQKVVK